MKPQDSSPKSKEKDSFDMVSLNKSFKMLTNAVFELKRNSSEASTTNKSFNQFLKNSTNQ